MHSLLLLKLSYNISYSYNSSYNEPSLPWTDVFQKLIKVQHFGSKGLDRLFSSRSTARNLLVLGLDSQTEENRPTIDHGIWLPSPTKNTWRLTEYDVTAFTLECNVHVLCGTRVQRNVPGGTVLERKRQSMLGDDGEFWTYWLVSENVFLEYWSHRSHV